MAQSLQDKRTEWLRRYIPAEILGTLAAVVAAWLAYTSSHSFIAAAAAGWAGEGVVFYGYFVVRELAAHHARYREHRFFKRVSLALASASTNLLVEFLPAEILDNFIVRPYLMYLLPQLIHPYPVGFLAGKFAADILFYALAIGGYEVHKKWLCR